MDTGEKATSGCIPKIALYIIRVCRLALLGGPCHGQRVTDESALSNHWSCPLSQYLETIMGMHKRTSLLGHDAHGQLFVSSLALDQQVWVPSRIP